MAAGAGAGVDLLHKKITSEITTTSQVLSKAKKYLNVDKTRDEHFCASPSLMAAVISVRS